MFIGERIKQRREQLGMSQEELCEKLGYKNRSTLSKIENYGESLSTSKVMAFAEALYTTPAYLMGWEDEEAELQRKQALEAAFNDRPEMRTLFSVAKDASKEDIEKTIKILEALKK